LDLFLKAVSSVFKSKASKAVITEIAVNTS
jgi:hypothetical protein